MSKVLVDRDWLKRTHRDFDACQKLIWANIRGADPAYCSDAQDRLKEIDEMLAQPAEAEGVRDYLAEFAEGEIEARTAIEELLAALSAVTAERDRLESMLIQTTARHFARQWKVRDDDKKLDECLSEGIAMLEAERDRLRKDRDSQQRVCIAEMEKVSQLRAEVEALRKAAEPLEPVHGDVLPPIGSKVLIHLASCDEWIEHTVAGYYAWGDLDGDEYLHRVFVRVRDSAGYLNARLLKDVRPVGAAIAAKEA